MAKFRADPSHVRDVPTPGQYSTDIISPLDALELNRAEYSKLAPNGPPPGRDSPFHPSATTQFELMQSVSVKQAGSYTRHEDAPNFNYDFFPFDTQSPRRRSNPGLQSSVKPPPVCRGSSRIPWLL